MSDRYPQHEIASRQQWHDWLAEHHADSPGVWLVTHKKHSGGPHVPRAEIVDEALAFGWVDSLPRTLDEHRSQLLVTPRKPASRWSAVNKRKVQQLITERRMTPAGLAVVHAAQANGTWNALDTVEALEEPPDLTLALDREPAARRHWDAFPRSTRRAILEWITSARRTATRDRRINETARLAAENIRANQWRQPRHASRPPTPR